MITIAIDPQRAHLGQLEDALRRRLGPRAIIRPYQDRIEIDGVADDAARQVAEAELAAHVPDFSERDRLQARRDLRAALHEAERNWGRLDAAAKDLAMLQLVQVVNGLPEV